MYRINRLIILCCLIVFCGSGKSLAAWPWEAKSLVTINGISYAAEDYRQWWQIWKEPDSKVPEEPEKFIKWKLMVQEAEVMELDKSADFQKSVETFLNARTRMILKYDEVDSKLVITEQELQDRFDADYTPLWRVTALYFAAEAEALQAYQSVIDKKATFAELKAMEPENGGPQQVKQGDIQPYNLQKDGVFSLVTDLAVGEISAPQQENDLFVVIHLDEKRTLGADDFALKKKSIKRKLRKEKEGKLTSDLIKRLWEKYDVQVDENLVLQVALGDVPGEALDQTFITTNRENLPLHILVRDFKVEMNMWGKKKFSQEEKEKKAKSLTRGIIYDTILRWEARERKYEEKEPFKWSYEYFRENRLTKKYEAVVMGSKVSVTDEEIKTYYQEHIGDFSTRGIYTYTTLTGERSLVEKVWNEIELGQDFFVAAEKFAAQLTPRREIPESKMEPVELEAIKDLAVGKVSQPFEKSGELYIAKLVDIQPPQPRPLGTVKNEIKQIISRQKYRTLRQEYIDRLLSQSEVSVNQREWARLRQELQK